MFLYVNYLSTVLTFLLTGSALTVHLYTEKSPFDFPENRIQDLYVVTGALATKHRLNMELDLWDPGEKLYSLYPATPQSPRIWVHKRGRNWSAKIDDISL
jgi:hypothetical protein